MERTHFVHIHTSYPSESTYSDDEPYIFEVEDTPNPFDADDPEVAYHEYLAQRFAR